MTAPVALVHHPACDGHDPGAGHRDAVGRVPALLAAARADAALGAVMAERLASPATEADLLRVHAPGHVAAVRAAARAAARSGPVWLDEDTAVSAGSWDAALAAAGCAISAVDAVLDGEARSAFALARPPGHHATADRAMGFCLFNNVAVAAARARALRGVGRILVVDWDAHHGNGTQELFYEDPDVHVLSVHLAPHYPGTGGADERGAGRGRGATWNVPVGAGTPPRAYRERWLGALDRAFAAASPELVLVSAGLDVLAGDPEGGLLLEPVDLHRLAADLLERAPARGVVAVLEGGYALARIGEGLVAVLRALCRLPPRDMHRERQDGIA